VYLYTLSSFCSTLCLTLSLGDPQTFERAYREHRAIAFAAALRILRDPAAAEDVVQDCFAHLWKRPSAFDVRRGSLRTYIALLARSRAIDRRRARAADAAAVERLRTGFGPAELRERGPAERAIERERAARVASLVDRLPAAQREAVLLAFGKGLSAREMATALGVPPNTAKSRVRLGVEKLRLAGGRVA